MTARVELLIYWTLSIYIYSNITVTIYTTIYTFYEISTIHLYAICIIYDVYCHYSNDNIIPLYLL